jgi:hypothetical protein
MRPLMQHQAPRFFTWMRKLGKWFPFLWRYLSGVCDSCGRHVGFDSVISRHGFQCWPCHDKAYERAGGASPGGEGA